MVPDQRAAPIAVHPREVRYVVAVRFEPPDHRVLRVEGHVHRAIVARGVGAVEAHLVGALHGPRGIEAAIGAGNPLAVVRGPRGVGRLEQQVRAPVIVPHDEVDVARARLPQNIGERPKPSAP